MAVPHLQLIVGEFGSGKSLLLWERGLAIAEKYRKSVVANFDFDKKALLEYCKLKKYKWIPELVRYHRIHTIPIQESSQLPLLLERRDTVVLLDEAGIFLHAQYWKSVPRGFNAALVQCRKDGIFFLIACHFLDQVDKQIRENAQYFIECRGMSVYDKNLKNDRLLFRWRHEFLPARYHYWLSMPQAQSNPLRTFLMSNFNYLPTPVIPWRICFEPSKLYPDKLRSILWGEIAVKPSAVALLFSIGSSWVRLDKIDEKRKGRRYFYIPYRDSDYL
jgi:hypothetical protein